MELFANKNNVQFFHKRFKSIHVDLRFHAKPFGSSCVYLSSGESRKSDSKNYNGKNTTLLTTKPVTKLSFHTE